MRGNNYFRIKIISNVIGNLFYIKKKLQCLYYSSNALHNIYGIFKNDTAFLLILLSNLDNII